MNKHIEIRVNTNSLWAEYVSDILINRIGCSGVVTEEKEFRDEEIIRADVDTVKGYLPFTGEFDIENVKNILKEEREKLVSIVINNDDPGSWSVETREILEEEWAENWKKFWHPQKIGSKIIICPTWERYEQNEGDVIIHLDPGSAFGTGSHPTTRLCIQALEQIIPEFKSPISMADVGTGSGILAIAGVKLGVDRVVGVDNDASVISVAEKNAEKNGVKTECEFFTGSASEITGKYDVVTANILAEVLIEMMSDLKKLLNPGGILVLSGIIKRKLPDIKESLEKNSLKIREIPEEENWVAPVVLKT